MKYLCTSQNACFSTRAIVNLAVGASICHIFFRQFWPLKKPIARTLVTSTLRNNDGKRYRFFKFLGKWLVTILVTLQHLTTLVSPIEISLLK